MVGVESGQGPSISHTSSNVNLLIIIPLGSLLIDTHARLPGDGLASLAFEALPESRISYIYMGAYLQCPLIN